MEQDNNDNSQFYRHIEDIIYSYNGEDENILHTNATNCAEYAIDYKFSIEDLYNLARDKNLYWLNIFWSKYWEKMTINDNNCRNDKNDKNCKNCKNCKNDKNCKNYNNGNSNNLTVNTSKLLMNEREKYAFYSGIWVKFWYNKIIQNQHITQLNEECRIYKTLTILLSCTSLISIYLLLRLKK